jgi:phosphopantothenoylcysteine decarboxylase/phosphopantothenate--cysteine ligase
MYLPAWLHWLKVVAPGVKVRVILTKSATQFVGLDALAAFSTSPVEIDEWGSSPRLAKHIELSDWAEAYVVHPATMNFVSRLSAGLCDSPTLLSIQGTHAPVVVAAAAPPNFTLGHVWTRYAAELGQRPNVHLLAPDEGISARDLTRAGSPPKTFPAVFEHLNGLFLEE